MRNTYPLWKYGLLILVTILGFIYAMPNIYGEDPAIQISPAEPEYRVDATVERQVIDLLNREHLEYKREELLNNRLLIRFNTTDAELKAKDLIKEELGNNYTVVANLEPATPGWLSKFGAEPMKLGLDLRGGLHFLLEVDIEGVYKRRLEGISKNFARDFRRERLRYASITPTKDHGIVVRFRDMSTRNKAYLLAKGQNPDLLLTKDNEDGKFLLYGKLSPAAINSIRQNTVDQTATILRNRVNELGVGEAPVQQQGANRIAVDLPGIQDPGRAKRIIGGTATLEFRLVDSTNDASSAQNSGIVPVNSRLYQYNNQPILLSKEVILTGESITSASARLDEMSASYAVSIQLGGGGESNFTRVTRQNVGKLLAIVFVETKNDTRMVDGQAVTTSKKVEKIISVATIRSALPSSFQITGLRDDAEAKNLALFLRAGALPTNVIFVEERLIGPSLGLENIKRGLESLAIGMALILLAMTFYYRLFGMIANVALLMNLVLLVAILSKIGATLTLPGLAGIVLTVGMAVDANVLIYERIREELRNGMTPHAAIHSGYERAFATIVDANITTLIVALVLFSIGTGAIQGFAVTLTIGLITSMITAITFTRALTNLFYGHRNVTKLSIGV